MKTLRAVFLEMWPVIALLVIVGLAFLVAGLKL